MTEIPIDVWVDGDDLVRRMTLDYTAKVAGSGWTTKTRASTVTMEFYDYGAEVDVQPPPADEVTNLAELTARRPGAATS